MLATLRRGKTPSVAQGRRAAVAWLPESGGSVLLFLETLGAGSPCSAQSRVDEPGAMGRVREDVQSHDALQGVYRGFRGQGAGPLRNGDAARPDASAGCQDAG